MNRFILAVVLVATFSLSLFTGCSKPTSEKTGGTDKSQPKKPGSVAVTPTRIERSTPPALNRSRKDQLPAPKPGVLEKNYRATTNENTKTEIIYKLGEIGSREAVEVLGRLFPSEKDADLRTEMISILAVVDEANNEKLAVYKMGVKPDQPIDVRKEAIEGLGDLEDARAIPILQELTKDSQTEISNAAREALELVQTAVLTQ